MRDKILKIFLIAAIGFSAYGCGLFKKAHKPSTDIVIGSQSMFAQTMIYNARQLDSMCFVDGLSANLNDWLLSSFYDYETSQRIDRYAYIKVISESEELSYILTPQDTLYKVTKRIVKETEDEE